MTIQPDDQTSGLTRRQIIAGAGAAAAGATLLSTALPGSAGAAAPAVVPGAMLPQALDPAIPGLTYQMIDGVAARCREHEPRRDRPGGTSPAPPHRRRARSASHSSCPRGRSSGRLNAVYQGQPIVSSTKRSFAGRRDHGRAHADVDDGAPAREQVVSASTDNVTVEARMHYQFVFFAQPASRSWADGRLQPERRTPVHTRAPTRVRSTPVSPVGSSIPARST